MLTILNVAYPFAEVGPDAVGGAEQVVAALDQALCRAGHRSLVLARAGSHVEGELLAVEVPAGAITPATRARVTAEYRARLSALIARGDVDLLHFHGVDAGEYLPEAGPPRLVTVHLPESFYAPGLLRPRPGVHFTCVSRPQRDALRSELPIAATIENGIDVERFVPNTTRRPGYAACLGRICPEKGFDLALRAARSAGIRLRLAGRVFPYPEHEAYFRGRIQPLLDEARTFVGPVEGETKRALLADADCLIVPSQVAETSSLVTMEALATGTPVLVSDRGALPSLIEDGVTGFVAADEAALIEALRRVPELDRERCRAHAVARFDVRATTAAYLELYTRLIEPHAGRP